MEDCSNYSPVGPKNQIYSPYIPTYFLLVFNIFSILTSCLRYSPVTFLLLYLFLYTHISLGVFGKVLMSFSFYTNGCKILSTSKGSETLGAINGIRFLSMGWVILGHSYSSARGYSGKYFNMLIMLEFMNLFKFLTGAIINENFIRKRQVFFDVVSYEDNESIKETNGLACLLRRWI